MAVTPLLFAVFIFSWHSQATSHWMVTESGLLQSKVDRCFQEESPFAIAKPFDLLALQNQVMRWENIIFLFDDLSSRQVFLNVLWVEIEVNTDLSMHLSADPNCTKAGNLQAIDWYYSVQEDGSTRQISAKEYALDIFEDKVGNIPDCAKLSESNFNEGPFDHLNGVVNRENLSIVPENSLPEQIIPLMTVDQFGHWLNEVLEHENKTSWLHFNMASLFWRSKGDALKSIECSQRAIFHAPSMYRDIALLNMGTTLHMSKQTVDAITVFKAAIKLHPMPMTHFMLANAYAVAGDHDSALKHYEQCLAMNQGFKLAIKHQHGLLCHQALMRKIDDVKQNLKKLQLELYEYNIRESLWIENQAKLLQTMKGYQNFDTSRIEKVCRKVGELSGLDMDGLRQKGDKLSLIKYFIIQGRYDTEWLRNRGVTNLDSITSLQRIVDRVERQSYTHVDNPVKRDKIIFHQLQEGRLLTKVESDTVFQLTGHGYRDYLKEQEEGQTLEQEPSKKQQPKLPELKKTQDSAYVEYDVPNPKPQLNDVIQDFDRDIVWPNSRLCDRNVPLMPDNLQAVYPLFMPFERKGIVMRGVLTDKIGVPANVEHELPWHPPICPLNRTQRKIFRSQVVTEVMNTSLSAKLMEYVSGDLETVQHMQLAELGHRIHRAMEMDTTPKWIVYTLASLFWRVRDSSANALNCLFAARALVQAKHKDIVLTSLASLHLEMGHIDDGWETAREAFTMNLYEPHINFLLAEAHSIRKEYNEMLFHFKQVVRIEPTFLKNQARVLLVTWACALNNINGMLLSQTMGAEFVPKVPKVPKPQSEKDACDLVDPIKTNVCETDPAVCQHLKLNCVMSHEQDADRILKILNAGGKPLAPDPDYNDQNTFDPFLAVMPQDNTDKVGHKMNFDSLKTFVRNLRNGCGNKPCLAVTKEDLGLNEKKCWFEYLQHGYWLNIFSYKQLSLKPELRPPLEISIMPLSNKRVPECYVPLNAEENFYVWRLGLVDTNKWQPVEHVMEALNNWFGVFDFAQLGQKIAMYMELHPDSFLGSLVAGWWCGAGGRGKCAVRCMIAAYVHAPIHLKSHPFRSLAVMLQLQGKFLSAKEVSYLSFYATPKSKIEALTVAVAHTYLKEYDEAIWLYRYALSFDTQFLAGKHCLHATFCTKIYGETPKPRSSPPDPKSRVACSFEAGSRQQAAGSGQHFHTFKVGC